MELTKRQKWLQRGLRASWVILFLVFAAVLIWSEGAPKDEANNLQTGSTQTTEKSPVEENKLKVYAIDRKTFKLWSRDEAIKFGLDNVANTIVYLWVAASVLLGLIGRFMIDPLLDPTKGKLINSPVALILVRHSAIGSLISICFGFYAYLNFADMVSDDTFTIYSDLGVATFCQVVTFVLASVLLMFAVNSVVLVHLKFKKEA